MTNKFKLILLIITAIVFGHCKFKSDTGKSTNDKKITSSPKFSLAQWSFHRELFSGEMSNYDFIEKASELEFDGVEYVNQFFYDRVADTLFLDSLRIFADKVNVNNLLLMIDGIGNLGASNEEERIQAITDCRRWIIAARRLGCPTVRINVYGDGTPDQIKEACIKSIRELALTAKSLNVNILNENHGAVSSNGFWLSTLLTELKDENIGSLPDFNNWCLARENGQLWGAPCIEYYDPYLGLEEIMPFAKALSVKAFDFDKDGNETSMDYFRLFDIVRSHNYNGYLGIEFEGKTLDSETGILKTKILAEKAWNAYEKTK